MRQLRAAGLYGASRPPRPRLPGRHADLARARVRDAAAAARRLFPGAGAAGPATARTQRGRASSQPLDSSTRPVRQRAPDPSSRATAWLRRKPSRSPRHADKGNVSTSRSTSRRPTSHVTIATDADDPTSRLPARRTGLRPRSRRPGQQRESLSSTQPTRSPARPSGRRQTAAAPQRR